MARLHKLKEQPHEFRIQNSALPLAKLNSISLIFMKK